MVLKVKTQLLLSTLIRLSLSLALFLFVMERFGKEWAGFFFIIFLLSEFSGVLLKRWIVENNRKTMDQLKHILENKEDG